MRLPRMFFAPFESVNSLSCVRSKRVERSEVFDSTLIEINNRTAMPRPPRVRNRLFIAQSAFFSSTRVAFANRKQPISDAKNTRSRRSMTPLVIEEKWVRKLSELIPSITV